MADMADVADMSARADTADVAIYDSPKQEMTMPVISFVSPKGGVGKTTSALLLATELAQHASKVTVIDADPNLPIHKWSQLPGCPENLEVVTKREAFCIG